jgi:hypothetical protein
MSAHALKDMHLDPSVEIEDVIMWKRLLDLG